MDNGEYSGEGQVEVFDGLHIDFDFEGGELGAAEEEYDAEGGEVEEEDEERGGEYGGTEKWEVDVPPNVEGVRAKGAGGLFEFRVEAGEGVAYDTDDDGGVVEDVGEEDEEEG